MWNVKRDVKGKPMRDANRKLIQTSPKIQENGVICENLLELDGELPKKIVRFMSLRNRLGILTGWLEDRRLQLDGRLSAGSSGIASTHRQKHTTVVNVPKAQDDVLLGREFRSLFTVEPGMKLIGCDQAALEARCEAHWVHKYDPSAALELIEGDIHAINAKAFYPTETQGYDITSPDFNKDDPGFKPYRSKSKNGKYAVTYGASAGKLAKTLGQPEKRGKILFEAFWQVNKGLKELKDRVEYFWEKQGHKVWIPAIDGRRLHSRSQHSLVNLLFQSTGAIIVDYALCLFDAKMGGLLMDDLGRPYYKYKKKIVKRVVYSHDEVQVEAEEPVAEEIGRILEWCMKEAGVRLNLNVPLIGESKIGLNWAEVH
jgi:DNA polymerase I-like protein with 3'-5' exonuclease and polymerase domains